MVLVEIKCQKNQGEFSRIVPFDVLITVRGTQIIIDLTKRNRPKKKKKKVYVCVPVCLSPLPVLCWVFRGLRKNESRFFKSLLLGKMHRLDGLLCLRFFFPCFYFYIFSFFVFWNVHHHHHHHLFVEGGEVRLYYQTPENTTNVEQTNNRLLVNLINQEKAQVKFSFYRQCAPLLVGSTDIALV